MKRDGRDTCHGHGRDPSVARDTVARDTPVTKETR